MKTTPLVRSLLALLLLAVWGCGSWDLSWSKHSERSGLLIEPADAARLGFAVNWSTDLGLEPSTTISSVTLLDDMLVMVESPGNMVSAVSVRDGRVLWRRVIGEPTENVYPPVRDGERVYLNNDTTIFTVGATHGNLIATADLSEVVSDRPVLIGHYAIFGGSDGTVFAHDVNAGYAKWAYKLTSGIVTAPVQSQQNVFVADSDGIYAMLRAEDGNLLFRGRTFGPVTTPPATSRNGVYVASHDQSLYALNRLTGQDQWVYRTAGPLTQPPAAIGQSVYLPLAGKGLVALDRNDGNQRWRSDIQAQPVKADNGQLLLHSPGELVLVNEQTGRVISQADTLPLKSVIPGPDNSLLIVSPHGRIHRLNPKR